MFSQAAEKQKHMIKYTARKSLKKQKKQCVNKSLQSTFELK